MTKETFLLLNLALAFYNVGTIWAHEVDVFRTWRLIDLTSFHIVQKKHWRKLPYWVFMPVGASFAGAIALFWYHPMSLPTWEIWIAFLTQLCSHLLTAFMWGPWQARLSKDPLGAESPYLGRILKTHWLRTMLITACGLTLLCMAVQALPALS